MLSIFDKIISDKTFVYAVKPLVFFLCLIPCAALFVRANNEGLGANPLETLTHWSGTWAIRFLMLTLLITPLRRIFNWPRVIRLRRMLGLYVFFYASMHMLFFFGLDHAFDFSEVLIDITKRPFVTVGFLAWVLLFALAVTSNRFSMRRLAGRWQRLHTWVYFIGLFAVVHYVWLVKADLLQPSIYLAILIVLLSYRLYWQINQSIPEQRKG